MRLQQMHRRCHAPRINGAGPPKRPQVVRPAAPALQVLVIDGAELQDQLKELGYAGERQRHPSILSNHPQRSGGSWAGPYSESTVARHAAGAGTLRACASWSSLAVSCIMRDVPPLRRLIQAAGAV